MLKWVEKLFNCVRSSIRSIPTPINSIESLAILASLSSLQWDQISITNDFQVFLSQTLNNYNEKPTSHFGDEFLIQIVAASGLLAAQTTPIATKVLAMSKDLIKLLNSKQEDDEFVLQIAFCFARLIANPDLIQKICKEHEQILEYLINMTHDKNQKLCQICDQALQLVSEIDQQWFKRIAEERFCWHNAQWLDIVEGQGARDQALSDEEANLDEESLLSEQFRQAVFGADELLDTADLDE
ncbi:hypothetical protein M3Y97_01143700 [Aphelenchoides bicaudatus]|nr:hypothetical protein M3Y97_01143700 [Aphelenchoides bicaudatus]